MSVLDVEAVQAFVLVADLGSFTKAAQAIGTSQAAISVKVKRLEDSLGYRLLERTPRRVQLSMHGSAFLNPARNFIRAHELALSSLSTGLRPLSLGISDQVTSPGLPTLLAHLNDYNPSLIIKIHIDSPCNLMNAYDKRELDAVIVRREDDPREGELLIRERFGWFAAPHWEYCVGKPLRLASLDRSCRVRTLVTQILDQAEIAWTEVFIGGGMTAIGTAISAGLAVAAVAHSVAPADTVEVGHLYGFPALPDSEVVLHSRLVDPSVRGALQTLVASFRGSTNRLPLK
ncbi:LysR family transcriptional regulator [Aquirhabdus sp.]|uniref:LysR family transcriptional regulator n=1 Tax=Aquirhabdus sp. TaxID=2824160 RepID=UPI00396C7444